MARRSIAIGVPPFAPPANGEERGGLVQFGREIRTGAAILHPPLDVTKNCERLLMPLLPPQCNSKLMRPNDRGSVHPHSFAGYAFHFCELAIGMQHTQQLLS